MAETNDFIKYVFPEVNAVLRRTFALFVDLLIVATMLYAVFYYKLNAYLAKPFIMVIFASTMTALITYFSGTYQKYSDKCKARCDDLSYIEGQLNMALNTINDNSFMLAPFFEDSKTVKAILVMPENIELSFDRIMRTWNGFIINELFVLYDDYRRINSSINSFKTGYEGTIHSINKSTSRTEGEMQAIIMSINNAFKDQEKDVVKYCESAAIKTEELISQVVSIRKYLLPNTLKYIFWYITDWGIDLFMPLKGFFYHPKQVSKATIIKDSIPILAKWRALRKSRNA